jgi:hypothetical protein
MVYTEGKMSWMTTRKGKIQIHVTLVPIVGEISISGTLVQ